MRDSVEPSPSNSSGIWRGVARWRRATAVTDTSRGRGLCRERLLPRLASTYDAYDARDLPRALANLSADVDWDGGEGDMLHGKDAVAGSGWLDVGKPDGSGAPAAVGQHAMFVGQVILAMRIA